MTGFVVAQSVGTRGGLRCRLSCCCALEQISSRGFTGHTDSGFFYKLILFVVSHLTRSRALLVAAGPACCCCTCRPWEDRDCEVRKAFTSILDASRRRFRQPHACDGGRRRTRRDGERGHSRWLTCSKRILWALNLVDKLAAALIPLVSPVQREVTSALEKDDVGKLRQLVDEGIEVEKICREARGSSAVTAAHKLPFTRRCPLNSTQSHLQEDGMTALHQCAFWNSCECTAYLIDRGADALAPLTKVWKQIA